MCSQRDIEKYSGSSENKQLRIKIKHILKKEKRKIEYSLMERKRETYFIILSVHEVKLSCNVI